MTGTEPILQELVRLAKYLKKQNKKLPIPVKLEIDPDIAIMMVNSIANHHKQGVEDVIALLRGDKAAVFAWNKYNLTTHKCSFNDAHISRHEWVQFIESELKWKKLYVDKTLES